MHPKNAFCPLSEARKAEPDGIFRPSAPPADPVFGLLCRLFCERGRRGAGQARAPCGTGHKGNSGTPSRKDRARPRADPIGVQPSFVGNVNYTERKIGICSPQKNRGRLPARKGKQCHESVCFFCTKLWITYAHFLCASPFFLRCRPDLSTSVCTTAPDLCTISSFSVDKHRFLRRRIFFRKGVNTCRKRSAAGCTGCPSCPIKAAAGRSAPSAVSPERRPRANLISGRIRNGILVQLLQ